MRKNKLTYRFHNPNTADLTAEYLTKVFIESGKKKVEDTIRLATDKPQKQSKQDS